MSASAAHRGNRRHAAGESEAVLARTAASAEIIGPPDLLTVDETATFLRTSSKAVYALVERGQLPGVVRLGRRILVRRDDLRKHVGLLDSTSPT